MAKSKRRNTKTPKRKNAKTRNAKTPKAKKRKRENAKTRKAPSKARKAASKKPARKTKSRVTPKVKKPARKTKSRVTPKVKKPARKIKSRVTPKVRKAPRGFEDVAKRKEPDEAAAEIKERLEETRLLLTDSNLDSRVRIHRYSDESIDGELLVKVPRGTSANDVALEMEQAMGRQSMPGFWLNMGTRFTIKEDDEVYRKFRGFNDVNTHYQAAVPANWSEIPLIVRKVIISGMEKKYGRKADSIYVRLHWSPDGGKPRTR